jgi:circadian clock protein KaiC
VNEIGYENTAWDVSKPEAKDALPNEKIPLRKSTSSIPTKISRIPSGIPGLDPLIEGGFKKGSTILVSGRAGSGKTIITLSFLMEGIKSGETVMYLTFEENKGQLYDDMLTFGWDLAQLEKEGRFLFLQYTPEQVKKVLSEGGGIVETMVTKQKVSRIVIDSITSFTLLYQDELSKKQAALGLFGLIEGWGCTALVTSQDSNEDEDKITASLEFEADGIIFVYNVRKGAVRERAIEIFKMRGTKHPSNTFSFEINNKGVLLHHDKNVSLE